MPHPSLIRPHPFTLFAAWLLLGLAASMPLLQLQPPLAWHDQQRLVQVALLALAPLLLLSPCTAPWAARPGSVGLLAAVLGLGLASAWAAAHPAWALLEVSLLLGCLGLALAVRGLRLRAPGLDGALLLAAFMLCAGIGLQFLVSYASAMAQPELGLHVLAMLGGFSNPRFFGQVATLLLPLLLLGWAFAPAQWPRRCAWLLGALAVLTWAVVLSTGTRGTVLALGTSAVLLACLGPLGRRVALGLLLSGLLGALLSWLLFTVLPLLLLADPTTFHHPASRLTLSLSGREVIWSLAWDMIRQQPLLGVGPMHFAAHPNPIAAHPHNALLQGAAEWGLPAALLLLAWLGRAYWQLLRRCHRAALPLPGDTHPALRMALLASLTGAATQSLVDGVLVMPTTLVWLCVLAGWAWALCERAAPPAAGKLARTAVAGAAIFARQPLPSLERGATTALSALARAQRLAPHRARAIALPALLEPRHDRTQPLTQPPVHHS
ncbi:O-antigen ligase family protein [Serpentinimonas barnesii]|uniref:O-antigen ligase family protein n=1 Tax=Serpentinimonas barnesii TaxID=1458427 RepID=UPI000694E145|nr:O-antigen ligase family protein [Serpentinimonas barnesii]